MVVGGKGILYLKRSGICKGHQQKRHIVWGLLFWPGGFSRGITHFYGSSLAMTFEFFRISQTNLNSVEYLKIHFLKHPACVFWNRPLIDRWIFFSKCWDIYPAHYTGLELFLELHQNKICYILHPKYTSLPCFPIICTSAIWKSLF